MDPTLDPENEKSHTCLSKFKQKGHTHTPYRYREEREREKEKEKEKKRISQFPTNPYREE
jgi:hypothetical protein